MDPASREKISEWVRREVDEIDVRQMVMTASWYWTGKAIQRLAYLALMADDLGLDTLAVRKLKTALECSVWTDCSSGPSPLLYDRTWGGVVSGAGLGTEMSDLTFSDFGNSAYNDHHYHFGYFVVAAAALAKLDRSWLDKSPKYGEWVENLIRDVSNPDEKDPYFPAFRTFSWFDGHSWSRGILHSWDGKDEESTSEELNFHFGVSMWGDATGNLRLSKLGRTMISVASRSIREYFLLLHGNPNHFEAFVLNKVTGILFENKADYTTWFGDKREYIHGIQMIPLSPALLEARTLEFVQQEWDMRLRDLPLISKGHWNTWTSVLMTNFAQLDGEGAWGVLSSPECPVDSGLSRAYALYWTACMQIKQTAT